MGIEQSGGIGQTKLRRGAAPHEGRKWETNTRVIFDEDDRPRLMSHWLSREVEKFLQALFFPFGTKLTISLSELHVQILGYKRLVALDAQV